MSDLSDPKPYIDEAAKNAKDRGSYMLASPSHLTDEQWKRVGDMVRKKGPLNDVEKLIFMTESRHLQSLYFMVLLFECERL